MTRHDRRRSSYKWMDPPSYPTVSHRRVAHRPLPFIGSNISFRESPRRGLYLTRSKSFPYYLLAIALPLFQTSSSRFVLLDWVFGLFIPSFFHLSLRSPRRYISWRLSKPYPLWCFRATRHLFSDSIPYFFASLPPSNIHIIF